MPCGFHTDTFPLYLPGISLVCSCSRAPHAPVHELMHRLMAWHAPLMCCSCAHAPSIAQRVVAKKPCEPGGPAPMQGHHYFRPSDVLTMCSRCAHNPLMRPCAHAPMRPCAHACCAVRGGQGGPAGTHVPGSGVCRGGRRPPRGTHRLAGALHCAVLCYIALCCTMLRSGPIAGPGSVVLSFFLSCCAGLLAVLETS